MIKYAVLVLLLALASAHFPDYKFITDHRGKLSLDFGAQFVVQKAIQAQEVPAGEYKVHKIYFANMDDNDRKTFDVQLVATNGKTLRAFYCVEFNSTTNTRQVIYYGFIVDSTLRSAVFSAEDSPEEMIPESELPLLDFRDETEQTIYDDIFVTETPLLGYTGEEWIVGATENEMIVDSFYGSLEVAITPESTTAFNHNSNLQGLLLFGLDQVLNSIFNDPDNTSIQGSANSQFHISRIIGIKDNKPDMDSVFQQEGPGGSSPETYEFDVEVQNEQGVTLRINFTANDRYDVDVLNGVDVDSYRFRPVNAENSQE